MSGLGLARLPIETGKADAERRMRSAVDDVMDGGVTVYVASRTRRVDYDRLREVLEARGWKPVRVRPNNGRSQARKP